MQREHLPFIIASDAATSYGHGVSVAPLTLDRVRGISKLDAKLGDHAVLGDGQPPSTESRMGERHAQGLQLRDFHAVLSVKAPSEHINIMEGRVFLAALRWVLRRQTHFGPKSAYTQTARHSQGLA